MDNWILEAIKNKENNHVNIDYEQLFYEIAKRLMNKFCLRVGNKKFILTEIEFYYFQKNYHCDCNVHQHELQKEFGIYLHDKHGRGGMDITFGSKECYGGILVRGIKEDSKQNFISGPLNVTDVITKVLERKYEDIQGRNLLSKEIVLEKMNIQFEDIFYGPRIGLVNENDFLVKNYRFITYFSPQHKFLEKGIVYLASNDEKYIEGIKNFKTATTLNSLQNKSIRGKKLYERYKVVKN